MAIKIGSIYNYAYRDDRTIQFRKIGKTDQFRLMKKDQNGNVIEGFWWDIVPSIFKPSDKSIMDLIKAMGSEELVDSFRMFVCSLSEENPLSDGYDGWFPPVAKYSKDGDPMYDSKQYMMHVVEKISKSNIKNTIAQGHLFTVHDEASVKTLDLLQPEFVEYLTSEILDQIKTDKILTTRAMASSKEIRDHIGNISGLMSKICQIDDSAVLDIRFSARGDHVIYDTLRPQVLKITADDIDYVQVPEGLLRLKNMAPLGDINLDARPADFRLLEPRLPFDPVGKVMHEAWLLTTAFRRIGTNCTNNLVPIEIVEGPAGSAKTTSSAVSLGVLDPVTDGHVTTLKSSASTDELALYLTRHKYGVIDNISGISEAESNLLCTAVTGGKYEKRRLFSDNDAIHLPLRCSPIITTTGIGYLRPDLEERVIYLSARKFKKNISTIKVAEYMADYGSAIRGAYIKLIQLVLDRFSDRLDLAEEISLPGRLMEYAAIGDILVESYGLEKGLFINAYKDYLVDLQWAKADTDGIAQNIRDFVEAVINPYSDGPLDLTAGESLTVSEWNRLMNLQYKDERISDRGWSKIVMRKADVLERMGIYITDEGHSEHGRKYNIRYQPSDRTFGENTQKLAEALDEHQSPVCGDNGNDNAIGCQA